ncbi:MAG: DUF354 domain-containing protein, partial [Candidatus Cloacimonas sp.]|nr:DUF354 domain-containing protein [Candidatus Cloacimonas sp.]
KSVPIVTNLLDHYQIPFLILGDKGINMFDKLKKQLVLTAKMRTLLIENNIDLAIGVSALIVHSAKFTKTRAILFDDDDQIVQPFTARFVTPFADTILSPDALQFEKLNRAIYYPSYHELAYLHPNRFIPDPQILAKYGLNQEDKYYILRFNAFKAHHDIKEGGMSLNQKRTLVQLLSRHGKVFITTEATLDAEFEQYKLPIAPHEMHDFLYYSQMLVSDSQTMSSEAAVLGVPAFRCNSFAGRLSVLEEEEKLYGLTYAYLPRQFDWMLSSIKELLLVSNLKEIWQEKRRVLISNKIDVTAFWAWFIENYPRSVKLSAIPGFNFSTFGDTNLDEI